MKTIDEILEGVTARGKWQADGRHVVESVQQSVINPVGTFRADAGQPHGYANAAFAARATSNFEGLCRALEEIAQSTTRRNAARARVIARQALAESLKD